MLQAYQAHGVLQIALKASSVIVLCGAVMAGCMHFGKQQIV